jgi:cytoskeletal protein CcmA (bactofilin family)
VIGPTLVVRGEVTAEEDLLVRGRIEGTIDHNQTLNVHREGTVEAVVRAKEIHVEGTVKGDLFGTQRVNVLESGKVVGNVVAPRVGVSEGAHFKGMVDMVTDAAAIERRYQEQTGKASAKAADGDDRSEQVAKSGKHRGNEKSAADAIADKPSSEDKPETAADKQSGAAAS